MDKLMKNIIYFFLLTLIIKSQPISENLAFKKVMENLKAILRILFENNSSSFAR